MTQKNILTISELNRAARELLEGAFSSLWVEGEISNITQHRSGHWYFTLKDKKAQIRCAMFFQHNRKVKFQPEVGMHLLVNARLSLYEARGDYQLIVESMEEIGAGALQRAFEQLKAKLSEEGLFDEVHKQSIPDIPHQLGVITSPTGAAIRDICSVLERRFPMLPILIYPVLVQGEEAATQIAQAIELANRQKRCDVLLVSRGGGSLEDLWSFNEEVVARAIFKSKIPVVSGVGHEIDFTISDFVADLRAPTPSAAAELISPDQTDLKIRLTHYYNELMDLIQENIEEKTAVLNQLTERLLRAHPQQQLEQFAQHLDRSSSVLMNQMKYLLERKESKLAQLAKALHITSPLATLARGYSILTNKIGETITASKQIKPGELIDARLHDGALRCEVIQKS